MALRVERQTDADWPDVWSILEPVIRAADAYPVPADAGEAYVKAFWTKKDGYNAVARDETGAIIGVYYLKPDQVGPGDHVCNAGYAIAGHARRKGYAVELCLQSQEQARAMGFQAMKFNLVVAANEGAVKAWRKAGMDIIGTIPNAFRHPQLGLVDAYIMYKAL